MIKKIQIILDVLGVVFSVVGAALTGEFGYVVAAIWAMTAFTTHVTHLND